MPIFNHIFNRHYKYNKKFLPELNKKQIDFNFRFANMTLYLNNYCSIFSSMHHLNKKFSFSFLWLYFLIQRRRIGRRGKDSFYISQYIIWPTISTIVAIFYYIIICLLWQAYGFSRRHWRWISVYRINLLLSLEMFFIIQ